MPEERQELLKIGDKTVAFVQKSLEYYQSNPDLVPPFDVMAVETIRSIYQPILQMTNALSDTIAVLAASLYPPA